MAIFNVTTGASGNTVTRPPEGSFEISTLVADRCSDPLLYQDVDTIAYFNNIAFEQELPLVGDIVYSDVGRTVLFNLSGNSQDYNINNGIFVSLDADSKFINNPC